MTENKILLVDDDTELCDLLAQYLNSEDFQVASVNSGEQALKTLVTGHSYSAVVLDIMMPGMSGLDVLRELRKTQSTPVLMLTGRGDDIDRIIGLEMGADDYMAKPCNPRELAARLRAVLRRSQPNNTPQSIVSMHGIVLDPGQRTVTANNQILNLTNAEFSTLSLLMRNIGETLSKQQLTESALNRKLEAHDRSIDVHISRIRHKLAEAKVRDVIKGIRGVGYQMLTEGAE